jgi:hypothetical protein
MPQLMFVRPAVARIAPRGDDGSSRSPLQDADGAAILNHELVLAVDRLLADHADDDAILDLHDADQPRRRCRPPTGSTAHG